MMLQNDLFTGFDITRGVGASLDYILGGGAATPTSASMTRVSQGSDPAKKLGGKADSPPQPSTAAFKEHGLAGIQGFNIGPCNLGAAFGAVASSVAGDRVPEPSQATGSKASKTAEPKSSKKRGVGAQALPSEPIAGGGKRGRRGMDLVFVAKSHVEAGASKFK